MIFFAIYLLLSVGLLKKQCFIIRFLYVVFKREIQKMQIPVASANRLEGGRALSHPDLRNHIGKRSENEYNIIHFQNPKGELQNE